MTKTLPPKCVVTFFRKELTQLVEQKELPVIGQLHSEVLDLPIYRYCDEVCVTMPFSTAITTCLWCSCCMRATM